MARITTLGVFGIPGPVQTFVPKTPGVPGGPHNPGHITALTVYGVPGRLQTFTPKAPGVPGVPGGPHNPGHITGLTVYGIPGGLQVFVAKSAAPLPPPVRRQFFQIEGSSKTKYRRYFIVEED
jgi:hypothetical protein